MGNNVLFTLLQTRSCCYALHFLWGGVVWGGVGSNVLFTASNTLLMLRSLLLQVPSSTLLMLRSSLLQVSTFQHALDATLFTSSSTFQHALDATLFTSSSTFRHALDATLFTSSSPETHVRQRLESLTQKMKTSSLSKDLPE